MTLQGLPYTVFQPLYIYGPYAAKDYMAFFLDRLLRNRPVPIPAPGIQLVSLTHVEDVASLMAKACRPNTHARHASHHHTHHAVNTAWPPSWQRQPRRLSMQLMRAAGRSIGMPSSRKGRDCSLCLCTLVHCVILCWCQSVSACVATICWSG